MSDNPQSDRPAGDPLPEEPGESGVDGALQNTADLASDLSSELGADAPAELNPGTAEAESRDGIDDQLEEIDELLGQVGDELGQTLDDETAEADPGSSPDSADDVVEPFASSASADTAIDDEIETWDESFDDAAVPSFDDPHENHTDSDADSAGADPGIEGPGTSEPESGGQTGRMLGLLERGVMLLEWIDRPLGLHQLRCPAGYRLDSPSHVLRRGVHLRFLLKQTRSNSGWAAALRCAFYRTGVDCDGSALDFRPRPANTQIARRRASSSDRVEYRLRGKRRSCIPFDDCSRGLCF